MTYMAYIFIYYSYLLLNFFRVMSENKVNGFFVAPTALRAIKLADPQTIEGKKYNIDRYVSIDFRDILWSVRHRYREYSVEIPQHYECIHRNEGE